MDSPLLIDLTIAAARDTIELVDALPRRLSFYKIGGQLFDSGTSQAANYRAAKRARSTREFIAKLKIVEEESDEGSFWIDRLFDARLPASLHAQARTLQRQFNQITGMTVASIKTSRRRLQSESHRQARPARNP
jgi:four helix bundle protein